MPLLWLVVKILFVTLILLINHKVDIGCYLTYNLNDTEKTEITENSEILLEVNPELNFMAQASELNDIYCTSKQAASLLDVTTRTIQLWSDAGVLKAWKTAGGHRRFNLENIKELKGQLNKEVKASAEHQLIRVLVIEDDPDLNLLYKMTINNWNLPVILVSEIDGFKGLIRIGAWKPDIVITDIKMPKIDGIYMLKTLSKMKLLSDMLIIAVSAFSKAEIDERGGLPAGITLFTKPIPFDEIEKIVSQQCKTLLDRR